jgi:hypothetical protein
MPCLVGFSFISSAIARVWASVAFEPKTNNQDWRCPPEEAPGLACADF